MKRIICFIMMLLLVISLTGCATSGVELTDEETDAIAQYSAYLILKYDSRKNADFKLLEHSEYEKLKKEIEEIAEQEKPVLTQEPTPVPTEPVKEPEESNETSVTPEAVVTEEPSDNQQSSEPFDLKEIYNTKNFEITYTGYEKSKVYKNVLSSPEGKEILILNFDVKNISTETQKFVSSNYRVNYRITLDKITYEPKISLMENDIQYLNDPISPGDTYQAILVFFVKEDVKGNCNIVAANGEGSVTSTTNINIK